MIDVVILAAQAAVHAAQAAEAVAPVVQTLTPLQQWGPFGAVVVALGGPKAIGYAVALLQGRNGNGKSKYCPAHEDFALRLQERHDVLLRAIDKVEEGISRIHERIDDLMKGKR